MKFLLQSAPQDAAALKDTILCFRSSLHIDPNVSESRDFCALTLDTMGNSLRLRGDVAIAFMKSVHEAKGPSNHYPIDIWFCFYMHGAPQYRAKVESLIKKKASSGCIGEPQLLEAVKVVIF